MKTAFDAHCWAEIDLDALVHNFHLIRERRRLPRSAPW